MVPDDRKNKVLSTLLSSIIEDYDYHVDTGIVGTRYLWDVLAENNHADVAYKIITQRSYPGYGYMIKEGATTLWERWEKLEGSGMNSHNHIMSGSVDTFFFKYLAGITSPEPGWTKIKIKPFIPIDLKYASGSLNTIKGFIYSSWEKFQGKLKMKIHIPVGTFSEVWIPINSQKSEIREGESTIWQNGKVIEKSEGIEYKEIRDNYIIFSVGSGHYEFLVSDLN